MADLASTAQLDDLLKTLAGGLYPEEGQTLVRTRDGWTFGTISTDAPQEYEDVSVDSNGELVLDFTISRDWHITVTGTPIRIKNPTGVEAGRTYFLLFTLTLPDVEIAWGDSDEDCIFYFPDGVGRLSKIEADDHVTFKSVGTERMDGVIVKDWKPPEGLQ